MPKCCLDPNHNQGQGCEHQRAARRAKSQSIFTSAVTFLISLSHKWLKVE